MLPFVAQSSSVCPSVPLFTYNICTMVYLKFNVTWFNIVLFFCFVVFLKKGKYFKFFLFSKNFSLFSFYCVNKKFVIGDNCVCYNSKRKKHLKLIFKLLATLLIVVFPFRVYVCLYGVNYCLSFSCCINRDFNLRVIETEY